MEKTLALALALLGAGCVSHSVILGQTAAPLGAGAGEATLSVGGGYSATTSKSSSTSSSETTSGGFGFPVLEGNVALGLSDVVTLNLHGSRAGVQPGVKLTLVHGAVDFAVMPSLAFGLSQNSQSSSAVSNEDITSINVLAGVRAIVSHGGAFLGAGYDFLYNHNSGEKQESNSLMLHTVVASLGYIGTGGPLRIGIEADGFWSPAGSTSSTSSSGVSSSGGSVSDWGVLLALTLGARASSRGN